VYVYVWFNYSCVYLHSDYYKLSGIKKTLDVIKDAHFSPGKDVTFIAFCQTFLVNSIIPECKKINRIASSLYVYKYIYVNVCIYTCIYIYVNIYVCMYVYIYICTYKYIDTYK
jgi:hypothetical protein